MTTEHDIPYMPIDCDQHSLLEVLAMRRAAVAALALDADGDEAVVHGTVQDVLTRHAAEYLVVRDSAGCEHLIRLDRLLALYDGTGEAVWRQKNADTGQGS